jgi:hypothetical protein
MTFKIRIRPFELRLKSLGAVYCRHLTTTIFSEIDERLAASDLSPNEFVRWLAKELIQGSCEDNRDDATERVKFAGETFVGLSDSDLEEFADEVVKKCGYLRKTYEGKDIQREIGESAADFLIRTFRHYATEQKTQWERLTNPPASASIAYDAEGIMKRNLGLSNCLRDAINQCADIPLAERMQAEEIARLSSLTNSIGSSAVFDAAQRLLKPLGRYEGLVGQSAYKLANAKSAIEVALGSSLNSISALCTPSEHIAALPAGIDQWAVFADERAINQINAAARIHGLLEEKQRRLAMEMFAPSALYEARALAELAQTYALPAALDSYRTSIESLTSKLLHSQTFDAMRSPAYLDAFIQTSTLSDIFAESMRVDRRLQDATWQFSQATVPMLGTLRDYQHFLDAAGLSLGRWPHPRLISIGEKRQRLRSKLKSNAESMHVKKAKSLVHRYELTLRDLLYEAMSIEYGEDWAETRLPLCDCKDLLGKWKKRGGDVLDHADYAHYGRIMGNAEHFEVMFGAGFDDPEMLVELMQRAGTLRATLLHCHPFSKEDLRDLRLTWRTIETGLLALSADFDL